MSQAEDERIGLLLRKLRRHAGMTQEQLSASSRVSVEAICSIESGNAGKVRVDQARSAFTALDGHLYLNPWWHGANPDRLIDEEHAALVERAAALFVRRGWTTRIELTFAEFGERGSIDLLAGREEVRTVAVCEIKSVFGSLEDTNRSLDKKIRLAPKLVERAFGWRPTAIARLLIVRNDATNRRVVAAHATTMALIYPERARSIRAWLRNPTTDIGGIWFMSIPAASGTDSR